MNNLFESTQFFNPEYGRTVSIGCAGMIGTWVEFRQGNPHYHPSEIFCNAQQPGRSLSLLRHSACAATLHDHSTRRAALGHIHTPLQESDARVNLVPNAWFAALGIEFACEWITLDHCYARFPGFHLRLLIWHESSSNRSQLRLLFF
jgi:hypothetical protein